VHLRSAHAVPHLPVLSPLSLIVVPAFVAVVFEPLPERIDPFYAVLTTAGLGSLLGSALGAIMGVSAPRRALYAERGSLSFALLGVAVFCIGSLFQGLS
jgi:membrane protein YqaA with SNARE-associated domain